MPDTPDALSPRTHPSDDPPAATTDAFDQPSLSVLPARFRAVPYVYARHPQAAAPGDLAAGANCQLYAYAFLAHHGLRVPPLRSSELWADEAATVRVVGEPEPLDLLLFDAGPRPDREPGYAAHIGVHLGPDRVLHLCQEVGRPAIWSYARFAARPRYARLFGVKRCRPTTEQKQSLP